LHSRLRSQKIYLENYKREISQLLACAQLALDSHSLLPNLINPHGNHLVIIIGSQKGLAGTFNYNLIQFFLSENITSQEKAQEIIVVGKQMIDQSLSKGIKPAKIYPIFNNINFVSIAKEITSLICNTPAYAAVTVYTTIPLSFFSQQQRAINLLPLTFQKHCQDRINYTFEQSAQDITTYLTRLYIQATLEEALFESLLAEQAIRFLSMDAATQNADNLLNNMKLDYNKLRQALITRELTDLASSLS
ncbi:MAG TPA: F0F1 ATP synthase subunit gamma, partial [Candidatus Babeliaceae bacterium]|nr:F0F1 ATP synthase subunit gamma [Candidatus Babeliaceae bacterium]